MQWFKEEELLSNNPRTLGVYLALLACRFDLMSISRNFPGLMNKLHREILRRLRGKNFREATNSAEIFVKSLVSKKEGESSTVDVLDEIECKYYDKFREAYLRTVKKDKIREVEIIYTFLKGLAEGELYDILSQKITSHGRTRCGSAYMLFSSTFVRGGIAKYLGLEFGWRELEEKLFSILKDSNIYLSELQILPAPVLEESFIEELIE